MELIDLMPTLLEQLGEGQSTIAMDGSSLFSGQERAEKFYADERYAKNVVRAVQDTARKRNREIQIVGNRDTGIFVRPAKYGHLIGREIGSYSNSELTVELADLLLPAKLARVRETDGVLPNFVEGEIVGPGTVPAIALAVNSKIVDLVDVYVDEDGHKRFASIFDPQFLAKEIDRSHHAGRVELRLDERPESVWIGGETKDSTESIKNLAAR